MSGRRGFGLAAVAVVLAAVGSVVEPGRVVACSCISTTLTESVASSDVSFVGRPTMLRGPGRDGTYLWTFDVEQVLKGDAPAEIEVLGSGWGGECGVDYRQFAPPILVSVRVGDGRYEDPGCTPVGTPDDIATILTPLDPPDGSGPVAALAAIRHRWANLAALDASGRVISWGDLGSRLDAVAACPGTSTAVVRRWAGDGSELVLVDLDTMQPSGEPIPDPTMYGVDLTCVVRPEGGPVVVTTSDGLESGDGRVTLGVHDVGGAGSRTDTIDAIAAVVDRTGRVVTVPAEPGGEVASFPAGDPDDAVSTPLDADESAVGAALSADGRLAVLVAETGRRTSYDTGATAVALFDIATDGTPMRTGTSALPPSPGRANMVRWFDTATLGIVRTTDSTRTLELVALDGSVVSASYEGWDVGEATVLGDRLLRPRNGGLELVDRGGAATPLVPAPMSDDEWFGFGAALAAFPDGPIIPSLRPDPPVLHDPLGVAAPATTTAVTTPPTTAPAAVATEPTSPDTTVAPATPAGGATGTGDDGGSGGAAGWVALAVGVGLVAVVAAALAWRRRARLVA